MTDTIISAISAAIEARKNCQERIPVNQEWFDKWTERIKQLVDMLPSGSGWDCGTKIDLDASHAGKVILYGSYHHMNDGGCYDGWTEHTVTVTPGFRGINLRISGRNRNEIKSYLYDIFDYELTRPVVWDTAKERYQVAA